MCVCVCVCVCVFWIYMLCILFEMSFESLICWFDAWVSSLIYAFISMSFSLLEKPLFFKLDSSSSHPRQISFLLSLLLVILTDPQSIEENFWAHYLLNRFLTDPRSIEIYGFSLNSSSTTSRSVETLLHALFFTCFASFYYLVIHSIFFRCIHAFIWIPCAPLIIYDHLYVSRVKLYSFLYPLSIMTKRGRKCDFFLRFYKLGGEIHAFVRGSVYLLVVLGASFSFLYTSLVTIFTYIILYFHIWWWCMFSSPTSTCVVFFLSLYTCFFMYTILISVSHMMPWWILFKCFKKTGCKSLSYHELLSYKVFQEFVVGIEVMSLVI